jgi:hypothetical protein
VFADSLTLADWPTLGQQALVAGGLAWAMGLSTGPRCH